MLASISGRLLPIGFAVAVLLPATVSRAQTLDQLYEAAKLEKSLAFYAGGPGR